MSGTLYIMRGLPGSGKSTATAKLVKQAKDMGLSVVVCSTDDYHLELVDNVWKYVFKADKLGQFHKYNLRDATCHMEHGVDVVIIDNTNTTWKEIAPYAKAAKDCGYTVLVLEADTPWAFDVSECTKRNTHEVPKDAISRMLERYTPNSLINSKLTEMWSNSHRQQTKDM